MATLTGKTIANTYKDLLQVSNNNGGVDGTLRTVSDGEGTNSPLQLSNSAVNINGTFQLNGNTLTATASALNAVTDLSGVTGLVAMTGGTPLSRSIAVGTGLSVTNADGVAGNPTVELDSTAVVAGSYGPVSNFAVNAKGQVVSASTPVSVSIATVRTSEFVADNVLVSSNVSVKGDVLVSGGLEVLGDVSSNHLYATSINVSVLNASQITVSVLNFITVSASTITTNQLVVTQRASVSALNVISKVSGTTAVFTGTVSANEFDASIANFNGRVSVGGAINVTGAVSGTSAVFTGIVSANEVDASIANFNGRVSVGGAINVTGAVSGTSAVFTGLVSALSFYGDGSNLTNLPTAPVSVSAYTVNVLTVVSAATVNGIISATNFVGGGAGLTNVSAIFAASATNATNAVNATSAVFASSATNATNAVNATSAVFASSATNATNAVSAAFATSATNATNAVNATNATSAVFATSATNATSAVFATSATNATTAVNVASGGTVNAASGSFTGIVSVNEIDASIGNFIGVVSVGGALNVTGAVSGTSAVFTGIVSANEIDSSIGAFTGAVSVGGALNVVGAISGTNAVFSGTVSAASGYFTSFLNVAASTSILNLTAKALTMQGPVSGTSAIFTGTVSANIIDASAADFNGRVSVGGALNVTGAVSGTSGIFTGIVSVSAAIVAGAGTVGAPSYSTTGDTNTGLYFPAADTIAVATSGTERMRITSAGLVGIGTSLPNSNALLTNNGNIAIAAPTRNQATSNQVGVWTSDDPADNRRAAITIGTVAGGASSNSYISFTTNNYGVDLAERMRIDNAGNVGIGTSSPAYKLDLNGAFRMPNATVFWMNDSTGTAKEILQLYSDNNTYFSTPTAAVFRTNGTTERMRIDSSGNVGIGTSSPLKQLEITKSARAVITSLTDATSISVDFNTAQNFAVMLTGNRTLENPTNCVAGQTGSIFVMQNVSGGKTLSFGSNWKFAGAAAPTLTTTASAVDRIDYIVFTSTAIQAVATLDVR